MGFTPLDPKKLAILTVAGHSIVSYNLAEAIAFLKLSLEKAIVYGTLREREYISNKKRSRSDALIIALFG